MTVLAHFGHWYHVFLYLAPVVIVAGGLWYAGKRLPEEDVEGLDGELDGDHVEHDARSGA